MASKSKIAWTDSTLNIVSGCTKVSLGCDNCYAKAIANRFHGSGGYPKDDPFKVTLHPGRLEQPLHWKKSRKIFLCSMGDIFHEDVPDEFLDKAFAMMGLASWHTFQVLTKRPERMRRYLDVVTDNREHSIGAEIMKISGGLHHGIIELPFPNVWLGATVENQEMFNKRWQHLKHISAKILFISYEPALGPLILPADFLERGQKVWVIIGGESGPNARYMRWEWAYSVQKQCKDANVPVFMKQMSRKEPIPDQLLIREFPGQVLQMKNNDGVLKEEGRLIKNNFGAGK
ncbi:MAG: phage Gp37/Gp68 family protein [Nitrospinota bacterium]|nr:phage Gp37/Gp68 family protein [Nitrospinota bacterium]